MCSALIDFLCSHTSQEVYMANPSLFALEKLSVCPSSFSHTEQASDHTDASAFFLSFPHHHDIDKMFCTQHFYSSRKSGEVHFCNNSTKDWHNAAFIPEKQIMQFVSVLGPDWSETHTGGSDTNRVGLWVCVTIVTAYKGICMAD